MKTRTHFFNTHLTVETVSEKIDDFNNYLLCFKTCKKESEDKMFYWCSKKEYKSTQYVIGFYTAGPCENGKIRTLTIENTKSIQGHREEFIFEEIKEK